MPRRRRDTTAGLVFHVLNRGAKRCRLFDSADEYDGFEKLMIEARSRYAVAIYAYCLMPNHWHFVISPREDAALTRFMHWLTTTHARRWQLARKVGPAGAVYQGRYKAIPVSADAHFLRVCRYVERNPLRAQLVTAAEFWPWSSLARRHSAPAGEMLSCWPVAPPADWPCHVNREQTVAELTAIRSAIATDTPIGATAWQAEMRERLDLRRGRRRKVTMSPDPITNM